jgi:diguanylate cyclase (GGDEF)-like protein/PAS domain S-box-containing protein
MGQQQSAPGRFATSRFMAPVVSGLFYFAVATMTVMLASDRGGVATVWPADAVLLAFLLQRPPSAWWSILLAGLLGNVVSNFIMRDVALTGLLFGMAHVTGVLVAAAGLRRGVGRWGFLRSTHTFWLFLFWAGLVAPSVSGAMGAATMWDLHGQDFLPTYKTWSGSVALGFLIVTPFLFGVFSGDCVRHYRQKSGLERIEIVALLLLTMAISLRIFTHSHAPMLFLLYMPLMLITFRVGWLGTTSGVMIAAIIGAICTMNGLGPIPMVTHDPGLQAIYFQFFIACTLLTNLPVAVALEARKELMAKMQESEQSLRLLASNSPILILKFDLAGVCRSAIGASEALLERSADEIVDCGFKDISPEGYLELRRAHGSAIDEPDSLQVTEFRAFLGTDKWLEAIFRTTWDERGRCMGTLATIHDVTARKWQELALAHSAKTDSLTGLLNRAGFLSRLEQAVATARSGTLSIAMIDVDRFKLINDNAGHQAGDAVLQEIAARILGEVRASDAVGRLGGDEFVILLVTPDWTKVQEICDRIVAAVSSEPVTLPNGARLQTAISCGVARYYSGQSVEEFLHSADIALYEAKRGGRNRVIAA